MTVGVVTVDSDDDDDHNDGDDEDDHGIGRGGKSDNVTAVLKSEH